MKVPNPPDPEALIFNVQRFSLHDGPGIRTTVFFKGCPLRCAWCQNPESIAPGAEMAFSAVRCKSCFTCAGACEAHAILRPEEKRIDRSRCTACGRCAGVCPTGALTLVGRRWSAEALVAQVLKDRDFYLDSSGGLTLSGGEPMLQWRFLDALLPAVKGHGIHVNLETCGCFDWNRIASLLPHLDLIYFDLKLMDPQAHRRHCGAENARILENFARLAGNAATLVPRMPVVPGINDAEGNIEETARFLLRHGHDTIRLIPYHALGAEKLRWIDSPRQPPNLATMNAEDCEPVSRMFAARGIDAVITD